jgi:hypothetical protein
VGGIYAIVQANQPEFLNGYAYGAAINPPAGGYRKVATSKGVVELGTGARFGYAMTFLPTDWNYVESRDNRLGNGVSSTKEQSVDQVIFQVRAQLDTVENGPYGWARSEYAWAQGNLPGITGGSLTKSNRDDGDSADPATLTYTWMDSGVDRRVSIIVRERDKHLYFFAFAAPESEFSSYGNVFTQVVFGTKFDR